MNTPPAPPNKKHRVMIVDDHPLLRNGLAKGINQQPDLQVCGEANDAREAMSALARCHPDVVIVDLSLEKGDGLLLIKDLLAQRPHLPVLVLSMHHENLYAQRAIQAGAKGYVMKREPVSGVLDALRKVVAGNMALSENMLKRLLSTPQAGKKPGASPAEWLSDRELEVFRLLGHGLSTAMIATRLGVAPSTVETHRASIKQKLGLSGASELVTCAVQFVLDERNT